MNAAKEFDLLSDLAKLLRKYGPEAFERLARQLASPEFVQQLSRILSEGARVARQSGMIGNRRSASDYRLSLVELGKTDPEKAQVLVPLYDNLMAKAVVPTMQGLRAFALAAGLPPVKATMRPKAILEVVEALRGLPLGELKRVVERVATGTDGNDRSLANWTQIIFDKDLRAKKAE